MQAIGVVLLLLKLEDGGLAALTDTPTVDFLNLVFGRITFSGRVARWPG